MTNIPITSTKISGSTGAAEMSRMSAATSTSGDAALIVGEIVEATVVKALPDRKYLLNIKSSLLSADSQAPLGVGDKLTAEVKKLAPVILLRITDSSPSENSVINKYLLIHRSNPAALGEMFTKIGAMLENLHTSPISPATVNKDIEIIKQLFDRMLPAAGTQAYVNNLTGYVQALGLNREHELLKYLVRGGKIAKSDEPTSLKQQLMDMSKNLNALLDDPAQTDSSLLAQLKNLRAFADESIAAIETHQILNVASRETNGPYILQIPFAYPEGIRMQDIYIEKEKEQDNEAGGVPSFRMIIFLDLDEMGEMKLDVRFKGKAIDCIFHCQSEELSHFTFGFMDELKDILEGAGYQVGGLQCLMEENIKRIKEEYLAQQAFHNRMALNLFA